MTHKNLFTLFFILIHIFYIKNGNSEPIIQPYPQQTVCLEIPCKLDLLSNEIMTFHDHKSVDRILIHNGWVQGYQDRTLQFREPEFIYSIVALGEKMDNKPFTYNFFEAGKSGNSEKLNVAQQNVKDNIDQNLNILAGVVDMGSQFGKTVNGKVSSLVQKGLASHPIYGGYNSVLSIVVTFQNIDTSNNPPEKSGQHAANIYQIIISKGSSNDVMILCLYEDLDGQLMHGIYQSFTYHQAYLGFNEYSSMNQNFALKSTLPGSNVEVPGLYITSPNCRTLTDLIDSDMLQKSKSLCPANKCGNGNSCHVSNFGMCDNALIDHNGWRCNCDWDFIFGKTCEKARVCHPSPCDATGTEECRDLGNSNYLCICKPKYSGIKCNIYADACSSGPCRNGGTCVISNDQGTQFECQCTAGWTSNFCQYEIDECSSSPCNSMDKQAECFDGLAKFSCVFMGVFY